MSARVRAYACVCVCVFAVLCVYVRVRMCIYVYACASFPLAHAPGFQPSFDVGVSNIPEQQSLSSHQNISGRKLRPRNHAALLDRIDKNESVG